MVAVFLANGPTPEERRALRRPDGALVAMNARYGLFASAELERAHDLIEGWKRRGITVLPEFDRRYPANLRAAGDRPPVLFVQGQLSPGDERSVAVVGTRKPTAHGRTAAAAVASGLVAARYTVLSGLASGVDTAAHEAALRSGGRTVAVLGTGVDRCYPPENAALQNEIASRCAIVSRLAPGSGPTRGSFPMRNAVMSGLALATVIVEASTTSGTRIQARASLAQGRPVVLLRDVLEHDWATELASRDGVHVVECPGEVVELIAALDPRDARGQRPAQAPCSVPRAA